MEYEEAHGWGTGHANPIFQTYNSQFRYNLGLNEAHALDVEIVGKKTSSTSI